MRARGPGGRCVRGAVLVGRLAGAPAVHAAPAPAVPAGLRPDAALLAERVAAAARHPEDYGAQVALARAAQAAGDTERALVAWSKALALSEGGFEARVGHTLALTAAGRHAEARAAAADLVADRPDSGLAWAVAGWAWRWSPGLPRRSAWRAIQAYEQAAAHGGPGAVGCGVGWCRRAVGDLAGAAAAFAATPAPCGAAGLAALPQGLTVEGGLAGGLVAYRDHAWRTGGHLTQARLGLDHSSGLGGAFTVRRLVTAGQRLDPDAAPAALAGASPPSAAPPAPVLEAVDAAQTELWATVSGRGRRVGGTAVAGHFFSSGDLGVAGGTAAGARGWLWLSAAELALSASTGRYDDGHTWAAGAALGVVLWPGLAAEAGLDHARFVSEVDLLVDDQGTSAWGALRGDWARPGLSLGLVGRVGRELRPLRLETPAVWNLEAPMLRSGAATLGWALPRRAGPGRGAGAHELGLERARLAPLPVTPPEVVSTESTVTVVHLALSATLGPRPRETP